MQLDFFVVNLKRRICLHDLYFSSMEAFVLGFAELDWFACFLDI